MEELATTKKEENTDILRNFPADIFCRYSSIVTFKYTYLTFDPEIYSGNLEV